MENSMEIQRTGGSHNDSDANRFAIVTNSNGNILYLQAEFMIVPGSAIVRIDRVYLGNVQLEGNLVTRFTLINGEKHDFGGEVGKKLWRQAKRIP